MDLRDRWKGEAVRDLDGERRVLFLLVWKARDVFCFYFLLFSFFFVRKVNTCRPPLRLASVK